MKVEIRQFRESDAANFRDAVLESVDHVSPWLPWCMAEYRLEDARDWVVTAAVNWREGTDYRFLIVDADTDSILGGVGISQVVPHHRTGNLGYWVRKAALGQGVCTRAAKLVVFYAFDELQFQRIEVHVLTDNIASNIVAQKLGGEFEGVQRNKLVVRGESCAANCYSIVPTDYGRPLSIPADTCSKG
ncbi:MAG: RimJ/RimL family protein N-acetyltransferase [Halieaceae bacterium]|jgi:RimJ/RimL family protein N-acetyltransferase